MYLNAKNSLLTARISRFKYVFIIFFKKSDGKAHIFLMIHLIFTKEFFHINLQKKCFLAILYTIVLIPCLSNSNDLFYFRKRC